MCTHTQENSSAERSPYLLISAICLHLQSQNTSCGRYLWLALFLPLISVVNSCKMQKVYRVRNAPICHYPAQEAAGQDLEEIHNWGLDLNEVSELEAWRAEISPALCCQAPQLSAWAAASCWTQIPSGRTSFLLPKRLDLSHVGLEGAALWEKFSPSGFLSMLSCWISRDVLLCILGA